MSAFAQRTAPASSEAPPRAPDPALPADAASNGAGPDAAAPLSPVDIRTERDAAVHILLRMKSIALLRVLSLVAVDLLALAAAGGMALQAAGTLGVGPVPDVARFAAVLAYGVVLGIAANGAYGAGDPRRDAGRLARGVVVGVMASLLLSHLVDRSPPSVGVFALLLVFSLPLVVAGRLATDWLTRKATPGFMRRRMLLIGDAESAAAVLKHFNGSLSKRILVEGRLAPSVGGPPAEDADGGLEDLGDFLRDRAVDVVVVTTLLPGPALQDVVNTAFRRGVHVELVPTVVRDSEWVIEPHTFFGCPVLEARPSRLGVPQLALKRAFDLVFATTLSILLLPVFVLVAAAIRLDTPGPILFRQTRAGLGGRAFTILKFRTMVLDADSEKQRYGHLNGSGDPRLFKIAGDPRVTRVGRLLRALSLDELPQLFNIIQGDMSFVGPRPFFREDFELYEPHHFERLAVLPGLTGLWQISGRSEITDFESVVELDQEYIRNWSLLLDFRIMLQTLPALVRRHGAF